MKNLAFGLAATALCGYTSLALAEVVYLTNNSDRRLCLALTEESYSDVGVGYINEGWNCIEPGKEFIIDYDNWVHVAIMDNVGRDYVADSPLDRYANDFLAWVPTEPTWLFGIEVLHLHLADYRYCFYLGDNSWTFWKGAADSAELKAAITGHGFQQFKTYLFKAVDFPGGLGLSLN